MSENNHGWFDRLLCRLGFHFYTNWKDGPVTEYEIESFGSTSSGKCGSQIGTCCVCGKQKKVLVKAN